MARSTERFAPFRVQPRLDAKPWGGRRLADYGLDLPVGEPIGEALITASESIILDGPAQGGTLGALVAAEPAAVCGARGVAATGGRPLFPLLIKLIDAHENLSIQVHPDNATAARDGNRLGKTEAWHILAADPGAILYVGLLPGVSEAEFVAACQAGDASAASLLRQLPAQPGLTLLTPAGTVHALGAGTLLYEIQQPSDITYRLDDWGRVDAVGRPRQLHLDQGFAVLRPEQRPEPIVPTDRSDNDGRHALLVSCPYFALERIELAAAAALLLRDPASAQVVTCLQGALRAPNAVSLAAGQSLVVPAAAPSHLSAVEPSVILRAWVPGN